MSKTVDKQYLFETAPIPKAVASLSTPTVIASLVMLLYTLADTFFVGLLNDPIATAAVALAAPIILAFNAVNNLFGIGGSSLVSRSLGAKDFVTLRRASSFSFYCSVICGLLYGLICTVGIVPLLKLLGTTDETFGATRDYMYWAISLGAMPSILNVVMSYLIRAEGATTHAGIGTMSGCILNIVLDPLFILPSGFNMGAAGAGCATMISNCVACLYFFGYLFIRRRKTTLSLSLKDFSFRHGIPKKICSVGIPASIQNLLNVVSHILLNAMAAPFGTAAVAAMGIAARVSNIPWYVSNGISQGIMPLIGYTYAARMRDRMRSAFSFTAKLAMVLMVIFITCMCVASFPISRLFIDDAETIAYSGIFLRAYALSLPFLAMDFLCVNVFNALGRGRHALILAICRKCVMEIPILFLLNKLFPLYGLSYAQLCAEVITMSVALFILSILWKQVEREPAPII